MLKVTAATLNIRRGPGTGYAVIGTLHGDDLVAPLETADWRPVELPGGAVGWVSGKFLEQAPESRDAGKEAPAGYDFSTQEDAIAAIKAECRRQGLSLPAQIAYVLATVEWETNRTFMPVKEAYWLSEDWRRQNLRYYPYYGRGFVQLTLEENYRQYSQIVGLDLVGNPDKALEPEIALFILVHGFRTGAFTGKKITNYINEDGYNFVQARRCINGLDKAEEIAALAKNYLQSLT
jgi:predicted chitinase